MSYMAHNALIVVIYGFAMDHPERYDLPDIAAYRECLPEAFRPLLIGPIKCPANGFHVVAFLPDGSKKGWDSSNEGDRIRRELVTMFSWTYDGDKDASPYKVASVHFGAEDKRRGDPDTVTQPGDLDPRC